MFLLFFFCYILSCSSAVSINVKVDACSGTQYFKNPNDGDNILWYPFPFNSSNAPLLPDNDKCQFEINVAKGYSARVILYLNSTNPSGISQPPVQITNQFGKTEQVSSADEEYYYFTAPGGTINLDTQNGKVHFGFKVDWAPDKTGLGQQVRVNQSDTLPYIFGEGLRPWNPMTVTADTRVSVTVISYPYDFYYMYLRGVLVFDGPNINSPCLGTAYDIYTGNIQFVSTGSKMTLQFLMREHVPGTIVLQDYESIKNIREFQGMECMSGIYCGLYSMDATKGPVALQTIYSANYYEPDVLIGLDGTGTLEVYNGRVTKDGKNAQAIYNAGTSANYLPQKFLGPLKTYVLQNGKATLNITRDLDQFQITKSFGRKGFIASTDYGNLNTQFASGTIRAPIGYSDAKFNVKIASVDLTGNTFFGIYGQKNGETTFSKVFNSTNPPDMKNGYAISGDSMSVYYDSQRTKTTGVFLRFEVVKP